GEAVNGWTNGEGINYIVLRYAEILLIHAEALIEQNARLKDALEDINAVRARKGVAMPPVTPANQATLRQRLRHERRVELALEGQRYFDLIRWGKDYATLVLAEQGKA